MRNSLHSLSISYFAVFTFALSCLLSCLLVVILIQFTFLVLALLFYSSLVLESYILLLGG